MFEYAQSVFQHPNYDSELLQIYQLRRQKYTISPKEIELLKTLLLPSGTRNNPLPQMCKPEPEKYFFQPRSGDGYMGLVRIIQYQMEYIKEQNASIAKHPIKRFLPKRLFKQSTRNLKLALHFVKYHHYNLMALEHPDIAFNHSLGIESLRRRFQALPDVFNPTRRSSSFRKFSAKHIVKYLKNKSRSFILFRDKQVDALYNAFQEKITSAKLLSKQLTIVQNKPVLQQQIKAICVEKYTEMGSKSSTPQSETFTQRLASLLGFRRRNSTHRPPIRNLFMQEVNMKLADKSLDDKAKAKVKAIAIFSRKIPASTKLSDYSVLDGKPEEFNLLKPSEFKTTNRMVSRYTAFVMGSSATDITTNDMLKMPPPLAVDQFVPKVKG